MNRLDSGGTVFHAHAQGIPKVALPLPIPIEEASREVIVSVRDTALYEVIDYPTRCLSVSGPKSGEVIYTLMTCLNNQGFNLVFLGQETVVIPRLKLIPSGFSKPFAGLELAGYLVLEDSEEEFQKATAEDCFRALTECGLDVKAFKKFKCGAVEVVEQLERKENTTG